ncbi:MAG TPA: hypothetical protein VGV87_24740 [Blastocatellia bacterium]|nr:hypothetical protein [Blastocatellia bacterium]
MSLTNSLRIACISLFLPLIVFALLTGWSGAAQQNLTKEDGCEDADSRLLSLLDDCVQQRFKDIDKGFGFRRIIKLGDTPHRFKPENAKELKVVDELKTARLNVVLYLAGRRVLGEKPDATAIVSRRLVQGPASITPPDYYDNKDLPRPDQLWDQSRRAMLAFQGSNTYKFAVGKWNISARPVRATEQSCLDCHSAGSTSSIPLTRAEGPSELQITKPLRIGDPLGVVMYAYESRAK